MPFSQKLVWLRQVTSALLVLRFDITNQDGVLEQVGPRLSQLPTVVYPRSPAASVPVCHVLIFSSLGAGIAVSWCCSFFC